MILLMLMLLMLMFLCSCSYCWCFCCLRRFLCRFSCSCWCFCSLFCWCYCSFFVVHHLHHLHQIYDLRTKAAQFNELFGGTENCSPPIATAVCWHGVNCQGLPTPLVLADAAHSDGDVKLDSDIKCDSDVYIYGRTPTQMREFEMEGRDWCLTQYTVST